MLLEVNRCIIRANSQQKIKRKALVINNVIIKSKPIYFLIHHLDEADLKHLLFLNNAKLQLSQLRHLDKHQQLLDPNISSDKLIIDKSSKSSKESRK